MIFRRHRGSGRHGGARKRRVESCLALDVNELRRKGALAPGASGSLTWERDRGAVASVDFRADTAELILCYDGHGTEALKVIEQRVALSFVPAAFGGARTYFLCPGAECGRRVSVLYFRRGVFRCRHCQGLAYQVQREDGTQRAHRRADKLRARLGWPQRRALAPPIVVKPKGMWNTTFERLRGDAIAAEAVATAAQVGALGAPSRQARTAETTRSASLGPLPVQLACRTSVSSTSVTVTAPGAGCSITSTATVSTAGATGCFIRRAVFFTGARLDLALATVRFAGAALRALPRLAEFPLRSFARFCSFDCFLRLAMIAPWVGSRSAMRGCANRHVPATHSTTDRSFAGTKTPRNKGAPSLVSLGV
jgi:hypothetical protein